MREYTIIESCNGEEYHMAITVWANELIQNNKKTVVADGVRIEVDEYIVEIRTSVEEQDG